MKKRISFIVDQSDFFEMASKDGVRDVMAERFMELCLSAEPSLMFRMAMCGVYGITDIEVTDFRDRCLSCAGEISTPNEDDLCDPCLQIEADRNADEAAGRGLEGEPA